MSGNRVAVQRRSFQVAASIGLGLFLFACGGGNNSSSATDNLPVAFAVVGQPDANTSEPNANRSTTNDRGLAAPQGSVATNGAAFFAPDNFNNRVLVWNAIPNNGNTSANFALGQTDLTSRTSGTTATSLFAPTSAQIADNGAGSQLVVADTGNNRVLIWNTLPTSNTAPDVVVGQTSLTTSDVGLSDSGLNQPQYAAIAKGKLLVVDSQNNRVLIWNTVPATNGAPADIVLGQADFTSKVPARDQSSGLITGPGQKGFTQPGGLWTDGLRLLVADTGDNRVLYWTSIPTTSNAQATYVIGQVDFTRAVLGAGSGLNAPFSVAVSNGGQIYIADTSNNRVIKFGSLPIASNPTAQSAYGQGTLTNRTANDEDQNGVSDTQDGGSSGKRQRPTNRTLSSPQGVAVFSGVLYVTDNGNNRILQYPQ